MHAAHNMTISNGTIRSEQLSANILQMESIREEENHVASLLSQQHNWNRKTYV